MDSKRALYLFSYRGCASFMGFIHAFPSLFLAPELTHFSCSNDDEWSFTDMMFDMAVTIVPIGILLSALPAGFLTFAIRR